MSEHNQAPVPVNVIDGAYVNFVSNINTDRDKASHGHFAKETTLTDYDYEAVYQDWLAKKIINRPVLDMLRAGWYFTGLDDGQILKINDEIKRLHLLERLSKLLIWSRVYGRAYLVFGVADGLPLDQPFEADKLQVGGLQFITVLKKAKVQPLTQEYIPLEQSAGEPEQPMYYNILNGNGTQTKVHHSRMICIKQGDEGESVLLSIYYTLRNYISTNTGAASLVHEAKVDVIRVPGLMDKIINRTKDMMERFGAAALLKSINGMLVIDKDEEYQSKAYTFGGLPELMREFAQQTAGAADMPFTILFGQTTSGLNNSGEFDLRNYYDRIATDQNWILRPILERIFPVIFKSLLGVIPAGFNFVFYPLWQLDIKTRSEVEKNNTERDVKYLEKGIITEAMIAKQLQQDGTYDFIDDEHIQALDDIAGQIDDDTQEP
ncbi:MULTISPECIES: DUF1073 domain-containing protein [unclassified Acinetobacter]|uniref:DUF1073 domain-containing protein n=1 Tax=unclassified Acinetobacter TaxID=196816 RepID=UPI00244739A7|nr:MULTISPECIES: DUF1073 domain-containing protein [unclassified Acinetobacter]MDH0032020.1 DUF1073 domain-containing protein [Acinetobacter sp. GD04021]MDH0887676.1 DUF1073 domain-containing protein [Acinetobacter sp. GD03873]MDH1084024.1 DUF1073 domain-containing protein [Acinetobacter sp. GD03983]MDH2191049.1 DUF1073 domain-containing protein [Acinetobacter sp. GD03645]MDH2204536.1 DUF1073 domain-containing protein [Acinetobacter sp. GD03647]